MRKAIMSEIRLQVKTLSKKMPNNFYLTCPISPDHKNSKYESIVIDCLNYQYSSNACSGGHIKVQKNSIDVKKIHHKSTCYGDDYIHGFHIEQFFIYNKFLDPNLARLLTDLIGYIPFPKDIREGEITDDRITADGLFSGYAPIEWKTFVGIGIPKVFYDMSDYIQSRDSAVTEIQDYKIEDFEDYLQPLIPNALENLRKIGDVPCSFDDIVVYDYLGLDIINKNFTIIGNNIYPCNALILAQNGYMGKRNMTHFYMDTKISEHSLRSNSLCTPSILKIYGY